MDIDREIFGAMSETPLVALVILAVRRCCLFTETLADWELPFLFLFDLILCVLCWDTNAAKKIGTTTHKGRINCA